MTMHHLEFSSGREGKLRAACDRCHNLKNRCLRTGGPDSRCDRCERLDIDCVYRNTSRIGRPRTQRRQSTVSQPPQPCIVAEAGADTAMMGSPSDMMSLLVSPEVVHQPDMNWNLDFSHHMHHSNFATDPQLLQDPSRFPPRQPSPERLSASTPDSGNGGAPSLNAEQTTEKLLRLQSQLHRLLLPTNKDSPSADMVEESLEVIKTFLEILQAALATQGRLPPEFRVPGMAESGTDAVDPTNQMPSGATQPAISYITAQQALTCYSYILLMVDRIVGVVTSGEYGSTSATTSNSGSSSSTASPPASLSLGFFSLASQPALNAEVVLHLALRMVQRLRVLIQVFVSVCKDSMSASQADRQTCGVTPESLSGNTVVEGSWRKGSNATTASISVTSYAVADLVGERERLLVEKLSGLTGG